MESVKCMVACIYCMVLPKGGSPYEQFVMLQKKEDRISKRTKKTTLAVEYPNVYRNKPYLVNKQTEGYFDRGTTSVDTLLCITSRLIIKVEPSLHIWTLAMDLLIIFIVLLLLELAEYMITTQYEL